MHGETLNYYYYYYYYYSEIQGTDIYRPWYFIPAFPNYFKMPRIKPWRNKVV